jgi:hypothetical protein
MSLHIHPPVKKAKYYFSKVTMDGAQVVLKIPYAAIAQMTPLAKQDGYLTMIDISQDQNALDFVHKIERECLDSLRANNKKWFRNALEESVIQEMFDPAFSQGLLRGYVSFLRSHLEVAGCVDFPDWVAKCKLPAPYYITLVCDGLFIYPERFGLRWIVRTIKENKEDPEDIVPEYGEIINFWEEKIEARKKILDALLVELKTHFSDKAVAELKKYIL